MVGPYRFGSLEVNGEKQEDDFILHGGHLVPWKRADGHKVSSHDLQELVQKQKPPDILVVGTGAFGMMKMLREVRPFLEEAGVECHVAKTKQAIALYNDLEAKGEDVALAVHLTC